MDTVIRNLAIGSAQYLEGLATMDAATSFTHLLSSTKRIINYFETSLRNHPLYGQEGTFSQFQITSNLEKLVMNIASLGLFARQLQDHLGDPIHWQGRFQGLAHRRVDSRTRNRFVPQLKMMSAAPVAAGILAPVGIPVAQTMAVSSALPRALSDQSERTKCGAAGWGRPSVWTWVDDSKGIPEICAVDKCTLLGFTLVVSSSFDDAGGSCISKSCKGSWEFASIL
jgi:hypothetical protein